MMRLEVERNANLSNSGNTRGSVGILIEGGSDHVLEDNIVEGFDYGIIARNTERLKAAGNTVNVPDRAVPSRELIDRFAVEIGKQIKAGAQRAEALNGMDAADKSGLLRWLREHGAETASAAAAIGSLAILIFQILKA